MIAAAASVVNACQTQTGVATGNLIFIYENLFFFKSILIQDCYEIIFFFLADIEAVRNGDWPDSEPLKVNQF